MEPKLSDLIAVTWLPPRHQQIIWLPFFIKEMEDNFGREAVIYDVLCYTFKQAKSAIQYFYSRGPGRGSEVAYYLGNISILIDGQKYIVGSFQDITRLEAKTAWKAVEAKAKEAEGANKDETIPD